MLKPIGYSHSNLIKYIIYYRLHPIEYTNRMVITNYMIANSRFVYKIWYKESTLI